ncbi:MAG: TetR/AcrR family transcriptional regulator, partial [Cyanobacteria bacterium]|nr:TetR/AcrR family transcriptional regulator [Cyanobacteria bacterium GSL.Bin21]
GKLKPCDSQRAATQFVGMFLGIQQMQRLLGITQAPSPAEITAIVEDAVDAFLDGHQEN